MNFKKHTYITAYFGLISFIMFSCNTQRVIGDYTRTIDLRKSKDGSKPIMQLKDDSTFIFNYGISCLKSFPETTGRYRKINKNLYLLNSDYNNILTPKVDVIKLDTNVTFVKLKIDSNLVQNERFNLEVLVNDFLIDGKAMEDEIKIHGWVNKIKFQLDFSKMGYDVENQLFITKDFVLERGNRYFFQIDFDDELLDMTFFNNDTIKVKNNQLYFINDDRPFAEFSFSRIR